MSYNRRRGDIDHDERNRTQKELRASRAAKWCDRNGKDYESYEEATKKYSHRKGG